MINGFNKKTGLKNNFKPVSLLTLCNPSDHIKMAVSKFLANDNSYASYYIAIMLTPFYFAVNMHLTNLNCLILTIFCRKPYSTLSPSDYVKMADLMLLL